MRRQFLAFATVLLLTATAWADFDDGVAAYERGDYETAFEEFLPYAEQGDAEAQRLLGVMYGNGVGVPVNYAEAVKWTRLAAEQGNALAQFSLGMMYFDGRGFRRALSRLRSGFSSPLSRAMLRPKSASMRCTHPVRTLSRMMMAFGLYKL